MVKSRIWLSAPLAFALVLAASSVQCTADQSAAPGEAARAGTSMESFIPDPDLQYASVKIVIHPSGGGNWTIKEVTPKGPDICKTMDKPVCDGTQFVWTVVGHPMADGDRVIIKQAPVAPDCFSSSQWIIDGPNTAILSGPVTCVMTPEQAKYGVFWPYDVEFYKDGELKASTDPRGILR